MAFVLEHTRLGFCWWDLLALIVLIVVAAVFLWKRHEMEKEERDLEDQISELYADDTVEIDGKQTQGI